MWYVWTYIDSFVCPSFSFSRSRSYFLFRRCLLFVMCWHVLLRLRRIAENSRIYWPYAIIFKTWAHSFSWKKLMLTYNCVQKTYVQNLYVICTIGYEFSVMSKKVQVWGWKILTHPKDIPIVHACLIAIASKPFWILPLSFIEFQFKSEELQVNTRIRKGKASHTHVYIPCVHICKQYMHAWI